MRNSKRRFELADLILFVGACAVAIAVCVFTKRHWDAGGAKWSTGNTITFAWSSAGYCLATITAYLAAMVLRRKPSRREIVASRGDVCVLSICVLSLIHIPTNWDALFNSSVSLAFLLVVVPFSLAGDPLAGAAAALSAWLALDLASVHRSEVDWLDLAGRFIALTWMAFAFVQPILDLHVLKAMGILFR